MDAIRNNAEPEVARIAATPEPFGNICRAATRGHSGAFFSEGIRLLTLIVARLWCK